MIRTDWGSHMVCMISLQPVVEATAETIRRGISLSHGGCHRPVNLLFTQRLVTPPRPSEKQSTEGCGEGLGRQGPVGAPPAGLSGEINSAPKQSVWKALTSDQRFSLREACPRQCEITVYLRHQVRVVVSLRVGIAKHRQFSVNTGWSSCGDHFATEVVAQHVLRALGPILLLPASVASQYFLTRTDVT
eukprot:COSAG01_NODE_915_length_12761_cov_33.161507_11_plen_189_part_00